MSWLRPPRPPAEPTLGGALTRHRIHVDGETPRDRGYLRYLPAGLSPGAPLVIVLHGSAVDGAQMRVQTGYRYDALADEHGFAVVYPDGWGPKAGHGHWNDARKAARYPARVQNVDDVGFLRALVAELAGAVGIDPAAVLATGYSNGGQLCYRLALEAPDLVAAIAPVAANLPTPANLDCAELRVPVPTVIVNGTADRVNPYAGGKVTLFLGFGNRGDVRSSDETVRYFADLAGATDRPVGRTLPRSDAHTSVAVAEFRRPGEPDPVAALYTVHGGGHVYPQPVYRAPGFLGRTTPDLDAPAVIWNFFSPPA